MTEAELQLHTLPTPTGTVSLACRFVDEEGVRAVFIHGVLSYVYNPQDKPTHRLIWVMVHQNGHARQSEITQAVGISRRSLQYWVKLYREGGAGALQDKPKSGAPRKDDAPLRKRILRLREQRASVREIATLCQLSVGKVHEVLTQARQEQPCAQGVLAEVLEVAEAPEPAPPPVVKEVAQSQETQKQGSARMDEAEEVESRDRGTDRLLARLGMLEDAQPLFGTEDHVEWAGAIMAMVLWVGCPFSSLCQEAYRSLGSAFYGLGTVLRSLVIMALLRLHRPEHLRQHDPVKLGRILGLDRAPEVKTLRRKVHQLCAREKAAELMDQWARKQVEGSAQAPRVVMIDGHVGVYHGKEKIGQVYCNQARRVVKGRTENWVHLPGGTPLLSLCSGFNESLSAVLPEAMAQASALCGGETITGVFDRGGWSTELFERLIARGHHFITYRKGNYQRWGEKAFASKPTQIGQRMYSRAPCLRELELRVCEKHGTNAKGRARYRRTSRTLKLKEVRLLRGDGGETSIITSRHDLDAEQIATVQLSRWGSQENGFKYLLAQFDLDSLWVYGSEELAEEIDHPDPEHTRWEKEIKRLQAQRKEVLARIWRQLPAEFSEPQPEGEAIKERVAQWVSQSQCQEARALQDLEESIQEASERLERIPGRENARLGGYRQLKTEAKLLLNLIKMVAYQLESQLCELLAPGYANAEKEKRALVAAALRSSGSLRLAPGELIVQLDPQASPNRTRAVNALLDQLNRREARYPGSHRIIRFEPTPCPQAPSWVQRSSPHDARSGAK